MGLLLVLLVYQAQSQTVIEPCANDSTVDGNSSCSEERSSANRASKHKRKDMYGVIAVDKIDGIGGGAAISADGYNKAEKLALEQCKNLKGINPKNCSIAIVFKNTCGTVAVLVLPEKSSDGKVIWAGEVSILEQTALDNALTICDNKAAQSDIKRSEPCKMLIRLVCAIDDSHSL